MAGLLPPDHIEFYKRQANLKIENLRSETVEFISNFFKFHKELPHFPWTFTKTYETLRLLCDTIGHQNLLLEQLPFIIINDLQRAVGAFPSGYVPMFRADGKTLTNGTIPEQLTVGELEKEADLFEKQMYTYINLHFVLYKRLPEIPHSFIVGYKYLELKRLQTGSNYPLENLPNILQLRIIKSVGRIPNGYIPGATHVGY